MHPKPAERLEGGVTRSHPVQHLGGCGQGPEMAAETAHHQNMLQHVWGVSLHSAARVKEAFLPPSFGKL